jgi:hypothetical protein
MSNPVDTFLESCERRTKSVEKEKTAAPGTGGLFGGKIGEEMARGAIQASMGAAAIALGGAAVKVFHAIKKRQSYKDMLGHNQDLREVQQGDPEMFGRHFDSLYSLNPTFAADPIVAGTYMRQMSMNPATAGKAIVESLEARQKTSPFEIGLQGTGPSIKYKF